MSAPVTPLSPSAERLLAEHAAAGDNAAVEQLYDAYEQRLHGYCHRICRNPEDAADATQEAFCNVIQRLPGLDTASLNFGAYLFTAARNACMDIIKQRGRAEPTDEVPEDPFAQTPLDTDPERALLTGDQQRAAREANDRLPETQRTALALREVSELSYDEIAETLDMNTNAVSQLISRARLNFDKQLRAGAVIVAPENEDDERAIKLTSARLDGKINAQELSWLETYLKASVGSRLNAEAIQESAVLYRAIAPAGTVAGLKTATLERATDITNAFSGKDRGDRDDDDHRDGDGDGSAGTDATFGMPQRSSARRNTKLAAGAALVLVLALLFAGTGEGDQGVTLDQTSGAAAEPAPTQTTSQANAPDDSDRKQKSDDEPQTSNSTAQNSPQLTSPSDTSGSTKDTRGNDNKNKSTSGDDDKSAAPESTPDPPVTTPPAAEPTPTSDPTPSTPKPPKLPPGPGTICGTPGCQSPTPPPVP